MIKDCLNEIMKEKVEKLVKNYKDDLKIDLKNLKNQKEGKEFIWVCRENGTELMDCDDIYFKGSYANTMLKYYRDAKLKAFKLKISNIEKSKIFGEITSINYKNLLLDVDKNEKEIKKAKIELIYKDIVKGKEKEISLIKEEEYSEDLFFKMLIKYNINRDNVLKYKELSYA